MDTFEALTPEEIKLTTLQFIGQNLSGPLKELESFIVNKNPTLQGKTLDPVNIINKIPSSQQPPPLATTVNAGINISQPDLPSLQPSYNIINSDNNQLEFDFEKKARYNDILDALNSIKTKLSRIESKLDIND